MEQDEEYYMHSLLNTSKEHGRTRLVGRGGLGDAVRLHICAT